VPQAFYSVTDGIDVYLLGGANLILRYLKDTTKDIDPSIILEQKGFPRWDIFVEVVSDVLQLTPAMRERSDVTQRFGSLMVYLLSLTDIFVFKSVTEREGKIV
jgi:hypothetical protein